MVSLCLLSGPNASKIIITTMKHIIQWLLPLATLQPCSASILPESQSQSLLADIASNKKPHLTHDLVGFHKNLVDIKSISGNEKEVGDWLAASLKSQGYHVEKQLVEKDPERFNVFAWPGKTRDAKVLLTSHIDTVIPPCTVHVCQLHAADEIRSHHFCPTSTTKPTT